MSSVSCMVVTLPCRAVPSTNTRPGVCLGRESPTLHVVITIEAVAPDSPMAAQLVHRYMSDVASRWYGRPATDGELEQALRDEPYDDLQGVTGLLLIAQEDARLLGCAGVRFLDNAAELTKVFTMPQHRGRGVGSQLLLAIERACRERAIRTLRLDTRAALSEACAMYERNGFERVDAFCDEPYSDRWYSKTLAAIAR